MGTSWRASLFGHLGNQFKIKNFQRLLPFALLHRSLGSDAMRVMVSPSPSAPARPADETRIRACFRP